MRVTLLSLWNSLHYVHNELQNVCVYRGWIRYQKRSNPGHWLEYHEDKGQWQVKPTKGKGAPTAWYYRTHSFRHIVCVMMMLLSVFRHGL
jgi:hypothetical protein